MRFFIGKHYKDTWNKIRDGEDLYVAFYTEHGKDARGNLVNIRTGQVFFMEDYLTYDYEVEGKPAACFDATPMLGPPDRVIEVEIVVEVV